MDKVFKNGMRLSEIKPADKEKGTEAELVFVDEVTEERGRYQRDAVDIVIPSNHLELVHDTITEYKKWLKENEALQEKVDLAETEQERLEAIKARSLHFKDRFAGVVSKDMGDRLSPSKIKKMWEKFICGEYRDFLQAHVNLTMQDIVEIGVDKFFYVMGWKKPSDVSKWRNNKVRIGYCCHCHDQFVPMILQYNHGLCLNCKGHYSETAIRNFVIRTLNESNRYHEAQHDMMMDFHIMFYHDEQFRRMFLVGDEFAIQMEQTEGEVPEWVQLPPHLRPESDQQS
ncbi:hypothetical protein ACQKJG_18515 [Priestia megaterium]|uniref:hypothetical protein n=1 Tax=Priestia megaterium TaxID=1404 RepID=UPI003D0268B8